MSARPDGSVGIVETVVTDIREASIKHNDAGDPLNDSWLLDRDP